MTSQDKAPENKTLDSFDDWEIDAPSAPLSTVDMKSAVVAINKSPILFPCSNKPDHFPGLFSRSGLFGVAVGAIAPQPSGSKAIKCQSPYLLSIDGPVLGMADKRVYEAVVRIAKACKLDLNESLDTSLRDIATMMGLHSLGGISLSAVSDSLAKLRQCKATFRLHDKSEHCGLMLSSVDTSKSGVRIEFDQDFVIPAFGMDRQFQSNSLRRHQLDGSLPQWLHDFFQTHSAAHDLTLGYLRDLCGYGGRDKSFPNRLDLAMNSIVKQCPELASAFFLAKLSRHSNLWSLSVTRGPESPNFFNGSAQVKLTPVAVQKAAAKAARRRGVAL